MVSGQAADRRSDAVAGPTPVKVRTVVHGSWRCGGRGLDFDFLVVDFFAVVLLLVVGDPNAGTGFDVDVVAVLKLLFCSCLNALPVVDRTVSGPLRRIRAGRNGRFWPWVLWSSVSVLRLVLRTYYVYTVSYEKNQQK